MSEEDITVVDLEGGVADIKDRLIKNLFEGLSNDFQVKIVNSIADMIVVAFNLGFEAGMKFGKDSTEDEA